VDFIRILRYTHLSSVNFLSLYPKRQFWLAFFLCLFFFFLLFCLPGRRVAGPGGYPPYMSAQVMLHQLFPAGYHGALRSVRSRLAGAAQTLAASPDRFTEGMTRPAHVRWRHARPMGDWIGP